MCAQLTMSHLLHILYLLLMVLTCHECYISNRVPALSLYSHRSVNSKFADINSNVHQLAGKNVAGGQQQQKASAMLSNIFFDSFLKPNFHERSSRRKAFILELPSTLGRVIRGLGNFTLSVGRTINAENGNGTLSRLITNRLVNVSESLMGWVERSMNDLPCIPRLDAQECVKRCICEAHNQPKKYGAVGLFLQLFFPPYLDADSEKVVSKYQLAARYGRGENANCAVQYDGCMVNVLDILQGAINMVL